MVESHSFDVELAVKIGLNRAIILSHLAFLQKNFTKDGEDWTKTKIIRTIKKMQEVYPYLTKKEIRGALDKMEQDGILLSEIDNQNKFDRTKSYVLSGAGIEVLRIDLGQFDLTKRQIPFDKKANEDLTKRQMLNDSSLNDSSNDSSLKVKENLKNDFQNPFQNPSSTLKEEKGKKGTPGPGAAKPPKEKTGRKNHSEGEALNTLKEKNQQAYNFYLQNPDIWKSVMRYRIEINSVFASAESEAIAMVKFWKDAEGSRDNAEAMIEKTVSGNYKGFFPVSKTNNTQQPRGVNPYNYG